VELSGDEQKQSHKALLHRMTVPLGDLRPALLSPELAADLDDYLSFRHMFRNTYGFELRGERVMYLSGRFPGVAARLGWRLRRSAGSWKPRRTSLRSPGDRLACRPPSPCSSFGMAEAFTRRAQS
jgi:hypothetical protein